MLKRFIRKIDKDRKPGFQSGTEGMPPKVDAAAAKTTKLETNAFQIEVESDQQWKRLLKREGLIVIDVYASWAGPCVSMVSILKRIKIEINDERLWYAMAASDNINDLHQFKDQSEPCWVFVGGGKPVKVFRGCNVPQFTALIKSEFQNELSCIAGKAKRTYISIEDEVSRRRKAEAEAEALREYVKDEDDTAEGMNAVRKESSVRLMSQLEPYTVLVVQHFLLETGALTEIREDLYGEFKIIQERTVNLNEQGVRELYRIPYAVNDPDHPPPKVDPLLMEEPAEAEAEPPAEEDGAEGEQKTPEKKVPKGPKIKMLKVEVPPGLIGDTQMMLLESVEMRNMINKGQTVSSLSPLQTADDYIQVKVGPFNLKDALKHAPESFHALYGEGEYLTGVWCPRRYDDKRYAMINYFPRFITELLAPPPETGTPKYAVVLFPSRQAENVKKDTADQAQDVLASGTMMIPPEMIEDMLSSWALEKDSDAYKAKKERMTDEVFAISVNRTNSDLNMTIKNLKPIHISFDNTAGMLESGKLFEQLNIKLDSIPSIDETVSKFLARSKQRPPAISELAVFTVAELGPSRRDSETELKEKEDDDEDAAYVAAAEIPSTHERKASIDEDNVPEKPRGSVVSETSPDVEAEPPKEEEKEDAPPPIDSEAEGEGEEEAEEEA